MLRYFIHIVSFCPLIVQWTRYDNLSFRQAKHSIQGHSVVGNESYVFTALSAYRDFILYHAKYMYVHTRVQLCVKADDNSRSF